MSAPAKTTDVRRALHWVFKVGNLKKTVEFYEKVLGMHVLRHEEFNNGCEATCNGPYARPWSKTMIGYGPEKTNFVFELTYNYGIAKYARGDDLQHIGLATSKEFETRAKDAGYTVTEGGFLEDPDGHRFQLVEAHADPEAHRVRFVEIRVADISRAKDYYHNVLGMAVFKDERTDTSHRVTLGFNDKECQLVLYENLEERVEAIDHAKDFGRLAFATRDGCVPIFEAAKAAGDTIINEPIKLDTPGKATVEVTILADRDGYELCFVEETGFDSLSTTKEGDEFIDWDKRKEDGAREG